MNKYAAITLLATVLVGCDNNTAPLSFTPEMASFSNEFDFDPLRGPVKDFTQTLFNDKGEVSKRVTGTMSTEGCFDTLELHDPKRIRALRWCWMLTTTSMRKPSSRR